MITYVQLNHGIYACKTLILTNTCSITHVRVYDILKQTIRAHTRYRFFSASCPGMVSPSVSPPERAACAHLIVMVL